MTRRAEQILVSIGLTLFLLVVVPVALITVTAARFGSPSPFGGIEPPWRWELAEIQRVVSEPLRDDAVTDVLIRSALVVIWIAVVVIVVTTIAEVVHSVRHRGIPLPALHGIGWAQPLARMIAIGLIAIAPVHTTRVSLASSLGDPLPAALRLGEPPTADHPVAATPPSVPSDEPSPSATTHAVRKGESVFSIAAGLAGGDPARTLAIADAILETNLGRTMDGGARFTNPAYIEVGWELEIPASIHRESPSRVASGGTVHVVAPGDTLSAIAERHLGDADDWPAIWEANAGRAMPGSRTFDDPDLILPGWTLDVPGDSDPSGNDTTDTDPPPTDAPPTDPPTNDSDTDTDAPPTTAGGAPAAPTTTVGPALSPPVGVSEPAPASDPSTTSTVEGLGASDAADDGGEPGVGPAAPDPIRIEHAALLAAGVLTLVAIRRRRRLRAARPRSRVPEPRAAASAMERRLRLVDPGERAQRVDVALRAAASALVGTGVQIGLAVVDDDGTIGLQLTGEATLPSPWTGRDRSWKFAGAQPVEDLADAARMVGTPCVALAQIGVTPDGRDVLVDIEACPTLRVVGDPDVTDQVVAAVAASLAASPYAEVAHLVSVSLPEGALLGHRHAQRAESADAALELASSLIGARRAGPESSFELRSVRTGGEAWEPAVVLLRHEDDGVRELAAGDPIRPGAGLAIVVAGDGRDELGRPDGCTLRAGDDGWTFEGFGTSLTVNPVGISPPDLAAVSELVESANEPLTEPDVDAFATAREESPDEFAPMPHAIVVGLMGDVVVVDRDGAPGSFERSKTVELIAWLATHRERSTRTAARTALWDLDVRDATFANVVSEARRALARLVPPPEGEEWVARTLTEQLPLHELVVTDAQLIEERIAAARTQPPAIAIETLRPAVEMVRGMPLAGTSYLWPDAEGLTSSLVLLAISATHDLAAHALAADDIETVFWATGRGLAVLPGHEELIGVRMRAHARAGDLAAVRHEWESYERVIVADAWSDGEPAPKLLQLRRELLS